MEIKKYTEKHISLEEARELISNNVVEDIKYANVHDVELFHDSSVRKNGAFSGKINIVIQLQNDLYTYYYVTIDYDAYEIGDYHELLQIKEESLEKLSSYIIAAIDSRELDELADLFDLEDYRDFFEEPEDRKKSV